ncbi:MAG: spore coat associated protein CotJA [Clostridium sp.]|nr:spore coat associated protein CotJA [Clostridium sp.]
MDSYTDVSAQNCGCSCGCSQHANRPVPANTCAGSRSDAAMQPNYPDMSGFAWTSWDCDTQTPGYAYPETSWTQPGSASCTQTAPGCLEQQYPVAMAYVPWQQWQTTYAPERGLLQGTIFPDLDLEFNYGRCGR